MTDTYVGAEEVRLILGMNDLSRITRWKLNGRLPPPYSEPKCSPVWFRMDIEAFRDNGMSTEGLTFAKPPREMPILGVKEVAELLGVDKSQIGRWLRTPPQSTPQLPEPVQRIKAGQLWDRQAILKFRAVWRRRRRPTAAA